MAIPRLVQDLLLALLPDGGQRTARRNAWAGVVEGAARARSAREAQAALDAARLRRTDLPAGA